MTLISFKKQKQKYLCWAMMLCLMSHWVLPVGMLAAVSKGSTSSVGSPTPAFEKTVADPTPKKEPSLTPSLEKTKTPPEVSRSEFNRVKEDMVKIFKDFDGLKLDLSQQGETRRNFELHFEDIKNQLEAIERKIGRVDTEWRKEDQGNVKKVELENTQDLLRGLKQKIEKSDGLFKNLEDDLKKDQDQISSLYDTMTVLRKDMSDNTEDLVRLKKEIKVLAPQPSKEKVWDMDDVLKWPYWGVTAAGIALISFMIAVQPKK